MTKKPNPNVLNSIRQKQSQEPKPGGVAAEYRSGEDKVPTKKATFELPQDLHRALHLHAVSSGASMRDLVIRYIESGLQEDGVTR
jgi:hypothetical protein